MEQSPRDYGENADSIDRQPGDVIESRFELLALVGKGATGAVYKAKDLMIDRPVAIKFLLHPERSDIAMKRFRQEAIFASKLDHENISRTLAIGDALGAPYLVAEWLEGYTLAELLKSKSQLDPDTAVTLAGQICDGLNYAHNTGIIHRDIKPSNIFITKNADAREVVKIIDFGAAAQSAGAEEHGLQKLTQTGVVVGTPAYMSPEQCMSKSVDQRSDIYALGCTLYEMLSGKLPFQGSTPYEMLAAHLHKAPQPLNQISGVGADLSKAVMKALEKDPEKRYKSALEFKTALTTLDTVQLSIPQNSRPRSKNKLPMLLAGAALAGIVVALAWRGLEALRSAPAPPGRHHR